MSVLDWLIGPKDLAPWSWSDQRLEALADKWEWAGRMMLELGDDRGRVLRNCANELRSVLEVK